MRSKNMNIEIFKSINQQNNAEKTNKIMITKSKTEIPEVAHE